MPSIGEPFTVLQSVDSTNNYAMAQVHAGLASHGNAYFAMEQTGGKGQRGKSWQSTIGENIIISIVIQPGSLLLSDSFLLSSAIALGCYDLVNRYAGEGSSIKWPNDLYWRDRKAGGILIENLVKGTHWQYAVAGIGLNVNQTKFAGELRNPVSLKQITGKTFDIVALAKELCSLLQNRIEALQKINHSELVGQYNEQLYKRGEIVSLRRDNVVFKSVIKRVTRQGRLVAQDSIEQEYELGQVEWILDDA